MSSTEAFLTLQEVAAYLACAEATVKRLVRRGRIPATRVGTHLRFARADVEAYRMANGMDTLKESPAAPDQQPTGPSQAISAAAYLTRLQLISGLFTQSHTPAQVAELAVTQCIRALDATSGLLSLVRGDQVELIHAAGYPAQVLELWRRLPLDAALPLPDAVRSGEPRFVETAAALLVHYPHLAQTPILSAAWAILPLPIDDRIIGAIVLAFAAPRSFTLDDRAFLLALAQQCAQAIERARLDALEVERRAATEAARTRATLLAEAVQMFAQAQLDLPAVLAQVTRRIAEVIGDGCGVRLLSDDGRWLLPAVLYNPDPQAQEMLARLDAEPYPVGVGLTGQVAEQGQALFLPEIEPAAMRAQVHPAYGIYLDRFPIYGVMIVPLRVGDRVIGTLNVSRGRPGHPYTPDDLAFLQELADRAATTIEHARLYAAEQRARAAAERAAERTAILQAITAALSNPHQPEQIADIAMAKGMRVIGATAGALSLLNGDGTFSIVRMIGYPQTVIDTWLGRRYPATLDAPIPDAVRTRAPIWLEGTEAILERYPQVAPQLAPGHIGAWASVPLIADERVFGGFSFLFAEQRTFSAEDRAFMLALAQQCAQAIERVRLRAAEQQAQAEVEAARQRQAMLAEASVELASSLDIQATINTLAHLVVPRLADWCVIDMYADDGSIQTLVIAHADPAKEEVAWEMVRRFPINPDAPGGTAAVLRTLQPELVPEISRATLAAFIPDAEHLRLLMELGLSSSLCVPLIARGRALGSIALVGAESGRRYSEADIPFVEDLARRAALAIDNARLYRESQAAVQLRDTFFSVAAHELKTPLTSLLGQAQLIQRRAARDASLSARDQQSVAVIVSQAARLNTMILAMLDSARLEHGQLSIERLPVDLGPLIQGVIEEIRPTLDRHTLVVRVQAGPLVVMGDTIRLEQVLQNLIGNAVKYSPFGGEILVRCVRDSARARITVQDSGIGIPRAAIPHLFQRFYRAANVEAQHISGMGIGLYVVKEIISLHGGTVGVTSREGQGSTFSVSLPLAEIRD